MKLAIMLILLWIPASVARADAIPAPREDCPPGATGTSSHAGVWCVPTTCASDATCSAASSHGEVRTLICRPQGLCVRTEQYEAGGLRPIDVEPQLLTRTVVDAACTTAADCAAPARCEVAPRCVVPTLPELAVQRSGCSCSVAPRAPMSVGWLALGLAVSLRLRRRAQLGGAGAREPRTRA